MNNYDVTIGVEVHIELKSKTKAFSSAANSFAAKPNSQVSPVDAGYPGAMPSLNQEVVVSGIKLAHTLNMKIDPLLRFDRKNYFYPDLPKGYQITQFYHPIGSNGNLQVTVADKPFLIEFERVHIEEDTAKQIHQGDLTYLDYNRAGVPLLELVTKPIFNNAAQVHAYIVALRRILIALDISDAKMNEGSLRCDLNISLKPQASETLGTKVEIKNLNSLNNITLAINDEIIRQSELLLANKQIEEETRRFDEKSNQTVLMRKKTSAVDYKYFTEPNIFPVQLEQKWIDDVISKLPMLPNEIADILKNKFSLNDSEINVLLDRRDLLLAFEVIVKENNLSKETVNYLLGPVLGYLNTQQINDLSVTKLNYQHLAELITMIKEQKVNDKQSQKILTTIFESDEHNPNELLKLWDVRVITDEKELSEIIIKLIQDNPQMVEEYFKNPFKANKFFIGQVMKQTKGQANPKIAQELVDKLIVEYKK
ncbi:Asp-tRNA(Asn)/Glu-tRNA(Gln) amidotransferase subunit GatB [Spiroplasma platyhelix]|uniref:Aspartyl/glutamyl-tRNA(Asn/Gln) amidotransferase subunit B n=1 Tax=Spiroplasma platyhelix PALS-1 TaxID=1276218 RepID=A0A846UCC1_9MOLU|nr:Asp-tRNA(Asn)/Glu-tRNA(Gln) amidotransferase subunit GatB [Spiroplasma platyhelix]NKE38178.1 Asp-tRNA(Asn)/Glu-tRNA(Gln) amidotransferase subunit GatB [Spiroplasma platyhelix PALS-1]